VAWAAQAAEKVASKLTITATTEKPEKKRKRR
jgi:hypothetical protein